jgi:hypothetical protein
MNPGSDRLIDSFYKAVDLFNEVEFLVLEVVQRHGLFVDHRLDIELGEELVFLVAQAGAYVLTILSQQAAKMVDGFIATVYHIRGTRVEVGSEMFLYTKCQCVGWILLCL